MIKNASRGRRMIFHGSYTSLILARRKEKATPHAFIIERNGRYYVMSAKGARPNPREKFEPRIRFNWGFWDRRNEIEKGFRRPYPLPKDSAYVAGYEYGGYTNHRTDKTSDAAWTDYRASKKKNTQQKKPVQIYGRVLRIEAQKTGPHRCDAECRRCQHKYFHDFKTKPKMLGLSPGAVIRVPPGKFPILIYGE